jgi:4,5-DOPA dioxygenase extradiol
MPTATTVFIPHGGGPLPLMNDPGSISLADFLRQYPATIPRPDAIIIVSAHWEEEVIRITSAASPELLFDYYNFPPETYEYRYPAPGDPELATRMQALLKQSNIDSKLDPDRGFDHGVFVPLLLMYPQADIPCVQISLASNLDAALHIQIGQALSGLKDENLLVLGSGFSFHNMQAFMNKRDDSIDLKNQEFDAWLQQACVDPNLSESERFTLLSDWQSAPHADYCHSRGEHLIPLHVCYGFGQGPARTVFQDTVSGFIVTGYQW